MVFCTEFLNGWWCAAPYTRRGAENHMLQLNIWCSWWLAYVPETCRARNTLIKLPCCIKLAFKIISWGRCTFKQPSTFFCNRCFLEVHTGFWWGYLEERGHWEGPGVDGRIILEWALKKSVRRTGLIWLRIGNEWRAVVNMVMNLRVPYNSGNILATWGTVNFSRRTQWS